MKKITAIIGIMIIAVCVVSVSAYAETISFSDTHRYWSGWENGTGDDSQDTIGIPNFTGGQATVTSNNLYNITFNRAAGTDSHWSVLSPGDLFIDFGSNNTWDYVVDLTSWAVPGPLNTDIDAVAGYYNIYSLSLGLNSATGYIKSGSDNSGEWAGWLIRNNHPVAADLAALQAAQIGSAYFSGWGNGTTTQYSFDFDGLNLGNSGNFTIGWQPNCANDVVYENLNYTTTPEPMTVALVGAGVAGLLLRRRKA
jgi:hypothetical protein